MAKKKKNSKAKSGGSSVMSKIKNLAGDARTPKIIGITLIFVGLFLMVSFVSYLFTWKEDNSEVIRPLGDFLFGDYEGKIGNTLGRLGAWIAHQFFYYGFGITSLVIPAVLIITGVKLLRKSLNIKLWPVYKHSFIIIVWFSICIAFITGAARWGGAFGITANDWMVNFMGKFGTGAILAFTLLLFLVLVFNIDFDFSVDIKRPSFKRFKKIKTALASVKNKASKESFADNNTEVKDWERQIVEENEEYEKESVIVDFDKTTPQKEEVKSNNGLDLELDNPDLLKEETSEPVGPDLEVEKSIEEEILDKAEHDEFDAYDPTLDLSDYKFPSLDLLVEYDTEGIKIDKEELERNKNKIIETLSNYNIEISKIKATIGPTVTLYEIVPAPGVRISKIKNLEDDIALSLAALGIRIIAPIPGKGTIGIEVPNVKKEIVSMYTLIASEKFQHSKMELPVAIGKNIANEIFVFDLAKMPHLLMAGATGQGKSVGLNAVLISLLYKKHPSQIKFILVDPKKVELTLYAHIEKHYLAKLPGEEEAIITDTKKVIYTLNALCIEMDQRYDLLKKAQVRNIKEYNAKFTARRLNPEKGHKFLPYIVLVIDEFADLMMTAGKEVETPIARLAQLARAIGIHLIVATQRPSVNIITGVIKANFPARIAFKVTSKVDSRTILDASGADQLIGRGDMLLSLGGDLIRLQCGFVDTPEVDAITNFISEQRGYPEAFLLPEYVDENDPDANGMFDLQDRDELFDEAARTIVQNQQGSTSMLQRRLKLGYNRAGRLMDQLEAAGIVGPNEGSKAREVLISDMYHLEQFLSES